MRVSKDQVICGLTASTARRMMRAYFDDHSAQVAAELLDVDLSGAAEHLRALEAAGYIRRSSANRVTDEPLWVTTVQGNALAQASFGKPINRTTAERLLAQVVEKARSYNADPRRLLTVSQITVFGSYLDPDAHRLGDLDLAVTAVRRDTDGDRYVDSALSYAAQSKRSFGTFVDRLFWPLRELRIILKDRSPAISITDEDVSNLTDRFKVIYSVGDDPDAIQPPADAPVER
jgi:predicted nucleotidyltransferase